MDKVCVRYIMALLLAALLLISGAAAAVAEDAPELVVMTEGEDGGGLSLPEEADLTAGFGSPDGVGADEIELVQADGDDPEDAPWDDPVGEDAMILATPGPQTGYYAVAAGTEVWADAAFSVSAGQFPKGATVYADTVTGDGAALRIRFDTRDARDWALEIPAGYVQAEYALALDRTEAAELLAALKADARTRSADGAMIPLAEFSPSGYAVSAEPEAEGLGVAARSQAEIQAFVDAHPAYAGQVNLYRVAAKDEPYAIGRLSPVNQQSALNLLNQIRYIAGLDANLTLLSEREEMMASAALVLRLNGALSHYPDRPDALSDSAYDALYELGYTGAGKANIAKGYKVTGAILAYMADSDDNNIATVGHRRWILNPRMGKTVMGANSSFSAMYAHDLSGAGGQTGVAWPAQQTPTQYFSAADPWSLSFGRELEPAGISVDLVRGRDGRTWHFAQDASDGAFFVENRSYGQKGCVIFRPDGLEGIAAGDVFNVSVTDGASGEVVRYTVNFFRLDLSAATPLDRPVVAAEKTDAGNAISWSAVDRATGYYVCRRTEDTLYEIIADVTGGTSWLDATASADRDYAYQVYSHNDSVTCALASGVQPVAPAPTKVKLNKSGTVKLYANDTLRLTASFKPACAEAELTWKSSKKKVATVDQNGVVTPLKTGCTVISVRTGNLSASVKVRVVSPPEPTKVKLNKSGTVKLKLGARLSLTATLSPSKAASELTWSSSDKKVAKVTQKGVVKPLKAGTATITVRTANGKKAKVKVKVVDPALPTKVKLDKTGTVKLKLGAKLSLTATLSPGTAKSKLTWSSSDKKVARVSQKGVVTAVKKGTATITVRTANGKKAKVKIRVTK